MYCSTCSKEIPDGSKVCPECGAELCAEAPAAETRKEFFSAVCPENIRKNIKTAAIILYVCAVITLIVQIISGTIPVDAVIVALLAFWIQKSKSTASGIVSVIYFALSCAGSYMLNGTLGGWLLLAAAIYALVFICKGNKLWKKYQAENNV